MATREILECSGSMLVVKVFMSKGERGGLHSHPEEQVSYLEKGEIELILEDSRKIMKQGEVFHILPNAKHEVIVYEDAVIIDVFNPIREDLLG